MPTTSAVVSCTMVFISFRSSSGSAAATQWSFVFPQIWLGNCFPFLGHEVCALKISSSGDLSPWEETWRKKRLYRVPAYDRCSILHCASLWYVCLSCHAAESRRSPRGASVVNQRKTFVEMHSYLPHSTVAQKLLLLKFLFQRNNCWNTEAS